MSKRLLIGFMSFLLMVLLIPAFSAAAEENGYWTETVDENGQILRIFTYTEPVNWVMVENAGYGICRMDSLEPIAVVEQADVHLSGGVDAASPQRIVKPDAMDDASSGGFAADIQAIVWSGVVGLLFLLLFKFRFKMHRSLKF